MSEENKLLTILEAVPAEDIKRAFIFSLLRNELEPEQRQVLEELVAEVVLRAGLAPRGRNINAVIEQLVVAAKGFLNHADAGVVLQAETLIMRLVEFQLQLDNKTEMEKRFTDVNWWHQLNGILFGVLGTPKGNELAGKISAIMGGKDVTVL